MWYSRRPILSWILTFLQPRRCWDSYKGRDPLVSPSKPHIWGRRNLMSVPGSLPKSFSVSRRRMVRKILCNVCVSHTLWEWLASYLNAVMTPQSLDQPEKPSPCPHAHAACSRDWGMGPSLAEKPWTLSLLLNHFSFTGRHNEELG